MKSVGIGLPVYRNAKHLKKTLDSILAQTYRNIVVYIADDCSDDETQQICTSYAKGDNRVVYVRNATNLGAMDNHKKVLSLADTDYFMFARGHEILPLDLVENCVRTLEEDPTVVLAFAHTKWIDETDKIMNDKHLSCFDTRGCDVVTRCALVFWSKYEYFYGLTKTRTMKEIRALENIVAHDLIMILEMALIGSFAHINSGVRLRRYHYQESYQERIRRYQSALGRKSTVERFFPFVRLPFYLLCSIFSSHITLKQKILISFLALVNAPVKYAVARGRRL